MNLSASGATPRQPERMPRAEHARHVLDMILQGYASIAHGQSHETQTTF